MCLFIHCAVPLPLLQNLVINELIGEADLFPKVKEGINGKRGGKREEWDSRGFFLHFVDKRRL